MESEEGREGKENVGLVRFKQRFVLCETYTKCKVRENGCGVNVMGCLWTGEEEEEGGRNGGRRKKTRVAGDNIGGG